MNYQNLYQRIVTSILNDDRTYNKKIHHRHHIIPKCIGGNNDGSNLLIVTHREHFILHHILTKVYPHSSKLLYAFNSMSNKWAKSTTHIPNSKKYQHTLSKAYKQISDSRKNKVYATDLDNNVVCVSKEEFRARDDLVFHTKGMVSAVNKNSVVEYVSKEEFRARDDLVSVGSINVKTSKYEFKDTSTGQLVYLTKDQAKQMNNDYKLHCYSARQPINKRRFRQNNKLPDRVPDIKFLGKPRSKNQVVAFDTTKGIFTVVTRDQFSSNDKLVGTTDNMATVFDPISGRYIKIDVNKAKELGLRGPNVGKINVINKSDGKRHQILKSEKTEDHIPLGNKSLYVCKGIHYLEVKHGIKEFNITTQQVDQLESILNKS